jgi:hypothetical protein
MHKKRITYIFLLIGLMGIFGALWGTQQIYQSQSVKQPFTFPITAELSNSTITYTEEVERVTQAFRVNVDLRGTAFTSATKVNMTISYSNATQITYNLVESSTDIWTFSKYFRYTAPLGTQYFHIYIYNNEVLLEDSYDQDFEIINSPPRMGFELSQATIMRNNTLFFNITPTDAETPYYDLTWSWKLLFGIVEMNASGSLKEITNLSHYFPANTTNSRLGIYTLKGTVTDGNGLTTYSYAYFTLENNKPSIELYNRTFPDVLYPNQIHRQIESLILDVNVTDVEVDPSNINLRILIHKPSGETIDLSNRMYRTDPNWNFHGFLNFSSSNPIGEYTCEMIAYETINDVEYNTNQSFAFTLLNNEPNGENITYSINDIVPSGSGLRIKEFETITFTINVTDVDVEGIEMIQLKLLHEDGDEIIFPLIPVNDYIEYTISAQNLAYGQWVTWVIAVDGDGAEAQAMLSLSFDILPDTFNKVLPWIMLSIGAVIAFGVSMAVLGTRYITLRRNFDNLLSRSGDYKKPDTKKGKSQPEQSPVVEKNEPSSSSTPVKKKSTKSKHELFRKIKKK